MIAALDTISPSAFLCPNILPDDRKFQFLFQHNPIQLMQTARLILEHQIYQIANFNIRLLYVTIMISPSLGHIL